MLRSFTRGRRVLQADSEGRMRDIQLATVDHVDIDFLRQTYYELFQNRLLLRNSYVQFLRRGLFPSQDDE